MAAAYGGCDPAIVGLFFTISVGATGLQTSGIFVNSIDLSPNYSGTISGLSSTFGALSGVLGPALVGFLTPNVNIEPEFPVLATLKLAELLYAKYTDSYFFYHSLFNQNGVSSFGLISVCILLS